MRTNGNFSHAVRQCWRVVRSRKWVWEADRWYAACLEVDDVGGAVVRAFSNRQFQMLEL